MDELLRFITSLRKEGGPASGPDTLLFKDKVLDSLNVLSLIGYVEERIGRRLQDDEVTMQNFESPRKIAETFHLEPK
jgi:acyl carrier protein